MQNSFLSNGFVPGYRIKNDMNTGGFTDIAVGIALKTLSAKGLLESDLWTDNDGDSYAVYKTTPAGEQWLISNQERLTLKVDPETTKEHPF